MEEKIKFSQLSGWLKLWVVLGAIAGTYGILVFLGIFIVLMIDAILF